MKNNRTYLFILSVCAVFCMTTGAFAGTTGELPGLVPGSSGFFENTLLAQMPPMDTDDNTTGKAVANPDTIIGENQPQHPDNPMVTGLPSKWLIINLYGGLGLNFGSVYDKEKKTSTLELVYEDGDTETKEPYFINFSTGLSADILFLKHSAADGQKGLNFGVRLRYNWHWVSEVLEYEEPNAFGIDDDPLDTQSDAHYANFLKFQTFTLGPVLYYGSEMFAFRMNALFGPVINGVLTPIPVFQDEFDEELQEIGFPTGYTCKFKGFRTIIGMGFVYGSTLMMGLDLYYSHTWITMEEQVYTGLDKKTSFGELNFEFSVGFAI